MISPKVRDQAYIKQSNILSVLKILRDTQPISRKDLTTITGMSPTSITRIVGTLLETGLVVESDGAETAGRGRKAIALVSNPGSLYTLGFLAERTHLLMHLLDFDSHTLYTAERDLPDAPHTPLEVAQAARAMFEAIPRRVLPSPALVQGIGVSVPGVVRYDTGMVELSINQRWENENLRAPFEQVFGRPIWVENDVKASLIGEKDRLAIPRHTDAAYLFLGRQGISTAVTAGGELLRGERNAAGEVAHIVLSPSDILCDCGKYGCLQLHLVESYLIRRAQKMDASVQSLEGIIAAYRQQLPWAEVLISDFQRHLSLVLSLLDSICNPAKIILSGTIISTLEPLLGAALGDGHVVVAPDYAGASARGIAIIAMQHTLTRRLAGHASA